MLDRTQAPAFRTLQSVHIPAARAHRLDNGLTLHVLNVGQQPMIKLECIFRAGTWYETKRTQALFTARMLGEGTTTRNAQQISAYADQYGAFTEFNPGNDRLTVGVYTLVRYLPALLDLLADVLQHATFPEAELDTLRTITLQNLRVNLEKNAYVANAIFREKIFGEDHPYGRSLREADAVAITATDLRAHYAHALRGQPFDLVVSGQVTDEAIAVINRTLGQLPVDASAPAPRPLPAHAPNYAPVMRPRADSLQATIRTGRLLFTRRHPDYLPLTVLNEVLGGYFGSRLMRNIREEKGFTYGISSSLVSFGHAGYWVIGTDVKKESAEATLAEIDREVSRLRTELIPADELETVKNYLTGSFAGSLGTAFDLADRFKIAYFEGLPADYYDHYIARVQAVTAEELQRLANQYLEPTALQTVVVG